MKRKMWTDKLKSAVIPLIAYLLTGLLIISLAKLPVDRFCFILWTLIAGVMLGIRACFDHRAITLGITVYAAAVVILFWNLDYEGSRTQGVLALLGLLGISLFGRLFAHRAAEAAWGYGMLALLVGLEFGGFSLSRGIIALTIFLFLNSVSETLSLLHKERAGSLAVIYGTVALLTLIPPAPEKPYDWGFVVRAARNLYRIGENILLEIQYYWGNRLSDGIFHFGYAGYSDSPASLSMALKDKDVEQLSLYGTRTRRNLYLKGNVCDSYTGEYWENNLTEETLDYYTDSLMTLYAIFSHTRDRGELKRFMEVWEFQVTMEYIKTQSLFYPLKLLDITEPDSCRVGDNIRAEEVKGRGDQYGFRFIDLDYEGGGLAGILKDSGDITYNEETYDLIFEKMEEYYNVTLVKPPYQEFLAAAKAGRTAVRLRYLDTGEAVSEEVFALAEEITKDCSGDYEKCRALESYLRGFEYNRSLDVPENENLLDWFLFDRQEGYCVHYATALAVMLRCCQIPSRLAEGFLVDYKGYTGFCSYSVSSERAHTWVEAYIDGFGWIRLEPTSGNGELPWYMESAQEEIPPEEEPVIQEETDSENEPEMKEGAGENKKGLWLPVILFTGGTAAVAAASFGVILVHRRRGLKKSRDPEVLLEHLLLLLKKNYSPREGEETLREYFTRLTEREGISGETKEKMLRILGPAEKYWYGNEALGEEEIGEIKALRDGFMG